MNFAARLLLGLIWLLAQLPLPVLSVIGGGLGALLHRFGRSRRAVALRNVELCLPELSVAEREALVREHFGWLGRSLLERGVLWYAGRARLKRLIQVEGDVTLAERSDKPVMWLTPHFLALDVAGMSTQLFQKQWVVSIYQAQSNPVLDAAIRRGRLRFGQGEVFARQESVVPMIRVVKKRRAAFINLPDMDFGVRDAAFVPFFGVPAATLLAPSRLARALGMVVQPVLAEALPHGRGWRVRYLPAWTDWPTEDPEADAARMNAWIETEIRRNPAQYLWVHKRFKTRPEGQPSVYDKRR